MTMCSFQVYILFIVCLISVNASLKCSHDLLIMVLKDKESDSFGRMMRAAKRLDLNVQVLDIQENPKCDAAAGQSYGDTCATLNADPKLLTLKTEVSKYKGEKKKVIMILDSTQDYNILFTAEEQRILRSFFSLTANIIVSATDSSLTPSMEDNYPKTSRGRQYLDSGGLIGLASDLNDLMTEHSASAKTDYQSFITDIYLNEEFRQKYQMKLDYNSKIFHNWIDASELEMEAVNDYYYLYNINTTTLPVVVRGHNTISDSINQAGDYVGKAYNYEFGCKDCKDNTISLSEVQDEDLPMVLIAIFIEQSVPFFEEFLLKLYNLNYPKQKIHLFVHIKYKYNKKRLKKYLEIHGHRYNSIQYVKGRKKMGEAQARQMAIDSCLEKNCDYFLSLDATVHLDNPETLKLLIEQNRPVLAPMLQKNYENIVKHFSEGDKEDQSEEIRGVWNIPCMSDAYLIHGDILQSKQDVFRYHRDEDDDDGYRTSSLCTNLKNEGIFMYETDLFEFGHLVHTGTFDLSRLHSEMYEVESNRWDWERRYIVQNYSLYLNASISVEKPCQDVSWFSVTTDRFSEELIEIAESHTGWLSGKPHNLHGEAQDDDGDGVPISDMDLNNLDLKVVWMSILKNYIHPVTERLYYGYSQKELETIGDFIVRYKPSNETDVFPRHKGTAYSVIMGLNTSPDHYEGGGTRFTRYNCTLPATRVGWVFIHPNKFTHKYLNLPISKGTRYLLISLVDPRP